MVFELCNVLYIYIIGVIPTYKLACACASVQDMACALIIGVGETNKCVLQKACFIPFVSLLDSLDVEEV